MKVIEKYREKIIGLCEKHKVVSLFVFGSVTKSSFNQNSDIDFLVDFSKIDLDNYADNYFDLKFSLETLLNRKVDLIERKALRNPYLKKEIESTKTLVYGY
ncbi:nucleotidyltransferase domain-containing protein [Aequorivita sp. SDUM287046]|uniref:Nucleotidyltransferase domain-containing protein n=1 Tax=Aequorivita aurantiaca TaxID=3053356 RepID=A0ABT8DHY6_9FLAO|nr:nucleotidyltransferase domain-containing protein [Aequorivita aurantiaca]MDN3722783.1 nucleotidyltransferase domain-containing protein [Aequorivita aurantiaca]